MARRTPWVAAGIYQPIHQRTAYGRSSWSAPTIEEMMRQLVVYRARALPDRIARRVAVPMPHGATRWFAICPCCGRRAASLYAFDFRMPVGWPALCRTCLGLRYRSQYQGRRPEAAPERLDALRASAARARAPRTQARREERLAMASRVRRTRDHRHVVRRELAFDLAGTVLLSRARRRERTSWARIVHGALRESPERRAEIAALAPAWAAEALGALPWRPSEEEAGHHDGEADVAVDGVPHGEAPSEDELHALRETLWAHYDTTRQRHRVTHAAAHHGPL